MSADVSLWSAEAWSSAADVYLLAQAREGSAEAYGELWRRHLSAAYAVASRYRGRTSPEDIVAEASARVLSLIKDGKGPEEHFRSYFLSTVRTVAVDHARRDLRVLPAESDQLEVLAEPVTEEFDGDGIDADLVRQAFAGLSERDRRVLWHTTVEGEAPRTVAPALGLTANAVSARAMRAREALRSSYLDAAARRHVGIADSEECRWAIEHLGAHVRGQLPKRQEARIRQHLETCSSTAALAGQLTEINAGFPALLVPIVLLAGVSTPGFVSAAAVGSLSGGAASVAAGSAGVGAVAAAPTGPPSPMQAAQQAASKVTTFAAGVAIGLGIAGAAGPVPAAPVVAHPAPVVVASPAQAPTPVPALPTPPPATTPVVPPAPSPEPPAPTTQRIVTRPATPAPRVLTPPPPAPRPVTPRPPATTPPPPPATTPAPELVIDGRVKRVGPPSIVTVRVDDPLRQQVTVVLTTASGAGTLEVLNRSFTCTEGPARTVTCVGRSNGAIRVEESGLEVPEPILVTARAADGRTGSRTIPIG